MLDSRAFCLCGGGERMELLSEGLSPGAKPFECAQLDAKLSLSAAQQKAHLSWPYEKQLYLQPQRKVLGLLRPGVSVQADCQLHSSTCRADPAVMLELVPAAWWFTTMLIWSLCSLTEAFQTPPKPCSPGLGIGCASTWGPPTQDAQEVSIPLHTQPESAVAVQKPWWNTRKIKCLFN